jgi:hypothetical protein
VVGVTAIIISDQLHGESMLSRLGVSIIFFTTACPVFSRVSGIERTLNKYWLRPGTVAQVHNSCYLDGGDHLIMAQRQSR